MNEQEIIDLIKETVKSLMPEILEMAAEKTLLLIPDTIGNVMKEHAMHSKMNSKFYNDHPEFRDKKDVVASVIEMIDGENPLLNYDKILEKAVPEIKNRLKIMNNLGMDSVAATPDCNLKKLEVPSSSNGEI